MTASKDPTKKKPKEAQQDEEFVDVSPPQRNWKGIAISLLVIVVVCSLITMSVVVLTPSELPGSSKSRLTVADLHKPEFSVHDPEATWISDSEVVYRNRDGHVIKFNFALNETEVILSNSTFVAFKVAKYSLSADLKYVLFAYDVKQIYIFENNIYYQSDVRSNSLRITSSGMEGVIFNGLADWLYEEEILRSHLAHWWSPDGEKLAFLTINDSLVPNMALPQFTGSAYPRGLQYPYPMRHEDFSEAWISRQRQEPLFSKDRSRFFLSLPVKQGGQGDFHHITMFTKKLRSDQDEVRHLTSGDWEVTKIVAYDENNQIIYFLSTEDSAQQRHLYSVSALGLFPRRCLTCGVKEECTFFDANVSPDTQKVILHCKGPGVPAVLLLSFDDVDSYFVLENNLPLRSAMETKRAVQMDIRMITNDNFELPLKLIYPPDFSESYLYGLLLIVGSSPGDQAVTEEFSLDWDWVLVGSEQVIVARLDGRGSGFRGERVLQQVHQRLGTVDVKDQIAALEYLVKLPFIDGTRVGVFGEDYGSYITLMMLKSTDKLIRCAAAQAPVIDWTMYVPSPVTTSLSYMTLGICIVWASKVLPEMKGLQEGTLFLAHGTADGTFPPYEDIYYKQNIRFTFHSNLESNVHFQHSAELIKHLIKIGANYTMQLKADVPR
ncbi:hypothetical protein PAMP_016621 [Pampus punctatissimus]